MNAPRQSTPHQSHERTPTQPQREAQPQRDEDKKQAGQARPDNKPERPDRHEDERHAAPKK
jgi:hypothetical protein